jgi:hypothetical protein
VKKTTKPKAALPAAAETMTPERAALAEARKSLAVRVKEVAANERALSKAQAARDVAQEAVYAARALIDGLQAAREKFAIDTAHGRRTKRPPSPEAASQTLQSAVDELAICESAVTKIEADLNRSRSWAGDGDVKNAAAAILAKSPDVIALIADTERAMNEFFDLACALDYLRKRGVVPDPFTNVGLGMPIPEAAMKHPASPILRVLHRSGPIVSLEELNARTDLGVTWQARFDALVQG